MLLRRKLFLACGLAIGVLIAPLSTRAATDPETGASGTTGTTGTDGNPGQAGGAGGLGAPANADAGVTIPNTDANNTATATGGSGGNGGAGGNGIGTNASGGKGGDGGSAGNASAQASSVVVTGNALPTATATGGNGGNGGAGGSSTGSGTAGAGGAAANGGSATAISSGTSSAPTGNASAKSTATGGNGGSSSGTGLQGGSGGVALATASGATTPTGQVIGVQATQIGGNGGNGLNGANGGNGADSLMTNAISVIGATGPYVLTQQSTAGNGGSIIGGIGNELAGHGGNATSNLAVNQPTHAGEVFATVGANGGIGGNTVSGHSVGGSALASLNITNAGSLSITIHAIGGAGGSDDSDGGSANLTSVVANTTGAQSVVIHAFATGGSGGSHQNDHGASVNLTNVVDENGPTGSSLDLEQLVMGGNGFAAGNATTSLTVSKNVAKLLVVTDATAGNSTATSSGGSGGNAVSIANAINSGGNANAGALATAGIAPNVSGNTFGNTDVHATATATRSGDSAGAGATNTSGGNATAATPGASTISATANNVGIGGTAYADSQSFSFGSMTSQSNTTNTGLLLSVHDNASSPSTVNQNIITTSSISGASLPSTSGSIFSSVASQAAVSEGLPTTGDSTSLLSGKTNVTNAMSGGSHISTFLGISELAASRTITTAAVVQTTSSDYVLDLTQLAAPGELEVGLLGFDPAGNTGFQSLEFLIQRNGSTIDGQDYTFTNLASAESFFTDHVLDLGSILNGSGANQQLDLNFQMNVTTLNQGDGFAGTLIFANVTPEPGLMSIAIAGLLLGQWRRR
jgi:hypothetical protein